MLKTLTISHSLFWLFVNKMSICAYEARYVASMFEEETNRPMQ
jgi:hypothetical protein